MHASFFHFIFLLYKYFFLLWVLIYLWSFLVESSSYKFNENNNPIRTDIAEHSYGLIGHPTGIEVEKWNDIKYFIIKSLNRQNIDLSIKKGIWATQIMNERILEEAFHVSSLLFWSPIVLLK